MFRRTALILVFMFILLAVPLAHAQSRVTPGLNPSPGTNLRDYDFELGGMSWTRHSSVFADNIMCSETCGDGGGTVGPHSGTHFVWFGGTLAAEFAYVEQAVVIPQTGGEVGLEYEMWVGAYSVTSDPSIQVVVDGIGTPIVPITGTTAGYVSRYVDLSAYADGLVHTIRIAFSMGNGGTVSVSLDDVALYKGIQYALQNTGFEAVSNKWKVTNGTSDKRKCNLGEKIFSWTGNCAFVFKGSAAENTLLTQKFLVPVRALPAPGRAPGHYAVYFGAFVNAKPNAKGKMSFVLTMSDNSKLKSSVTLAGVGEYAWKQTPPKSYANGLSVVKVQVNISHKSHSGKVLIDDVEMFETADYS